MGRSKKTRPVRPVLLLEINEVPWRLLDHFRGEFPNIDRFFDQSQTYTTMAVDSGELSPWITWPSFHRGLSNREHGVQFLGQDPATFKGTPIWEDYRAQGLSIGICGSLQSWPPVDPGPGGFFIPDTFAHDERCIPSFVEPFQKFNLGQVARNGRVVKAGSVLTHDAVPLLKSLPSLGIRAETVGKVARQLVAERFDKVKIARRPVFQSILVWDVFRKLFDPAHPPAFTTFFSNHVAGVMHRYWDHVFPGDFGEERLTKPTPHLETMKFALAFTDQLLGEVFAFMERNPDLIVVWASSMGQDTIRREHEGGECAVSDTPRLMSVCGLQTTEFKTLLAMVPQVAVEIPDAARRAHVRKTLETARTSSGARLFKVESAKSGLSITILKTPRADLKAGAFTMAGRSYRWEAAGVQVIEAEPGTAYHIADGVMAVCGRGFEPSSARKPIRASDCKSLLLELGGLKQTAPLKKAK